MDAADRLGATEQIRVLTAEEARRVADSPTFRGGAASTATA